MPVTEEEREEFGEEGQGVGAPNLARRLIDSVRRRKGLAVDEKVRLQLLAYTHCEIWVDVR